MVKLKEKGTEITYRIEVPLVAFLGDSGPNDYSHMPHVAEAKALLVECTFFDDEHISRARAGRHTHVCDLPKVLAGMNNERIIIIHITRRTNMAVARKIMHKALPKETLERITFLMSRKHIEEE